MRRAIAEASRACCRAVAERRLRRHVSEASQGNCRGGVKARAVVRGIGKRDRGAVVSVQCGAVCSRLDSAPICCANAWFGPSLCHVFRGDPGTTLRMTRLRFCFALVDCKCHEGINFALCRRSGQRTGANGRDGRAFASGGCDSRITAGRGRGNLRCHRSHNRARR